MAIEVKFGDAASVVRKPAARLSAEVESGSYSSPLIDIPSAIGMYHPRGRGVACATLTALLNTISPTEKTIQPTTSIVADFGDSCKGSAQVNDLTGLDELGEVFAALFKDIGSDDLRI